MSETLSAYRALDLLRMAARVDPYLRQSVADVEAHIEALQAEVTTLRTALLDVQAIQSEYDRKPYLIPVGGWMAIRERLQHADVREALHGRE